MENHALTPDPSPPSTGERGVECSREQLSYRLRIHQPDGPLARSRHHRRVEIDAHALVNRRQNLRWLHRHVLRPRADLVRRADRLPAADVPAAEEVRPGTRIVVTAAAWVQLRRPA